MTAILLALLFALAAATAAYVLRLKRSSKIEQRNLIIKFNMESAAHIAAEDRAREQTKANKQLKTDLECKAKQITELLGKVSELERNQDDDKVSGEPQKKYLWLVDTIASPEEEKNVRVAVEESKKEKRAKQSIVDVHLVEIEKLREEAVRFRNEKIIRDTEFRNLKLDFELKKETIRGLEEENRSLRGKSKQPDGAGRSRSTPLITHNRGKALNHHLICWKTEGVWSIGIELLRMKDDLIFDTVLQQEIPLNPYDEKEYCWYLNSLQDDIGISWLSGGSEHVQTITIANDPYLFFRLHGEYLDYGGQIGRLRRAASILMILSKDWSIAEDFIDIVVRSEHVTFDDYTAYLIDSTHKMHKHITLVNQFGDERKLALDQPMFVLEGKRVRNDDKNLCPIFGDGLPEIKSRQGSKWTEISTIIIGEEGSGRKKWHERFSPVNDRQVQIIPHILEGTKIRNGWYYLRFYDRKYNFIDSMDFKYAASLNQINTLGNLFPGEQGHAPGEIQFYHEKNCKIISVSHPERLIPLNTSYGTVVHVPPQSSYDRTKWAVLDLQSGRGCEVTIELDRIWWALGDESELPQTWAAKHFQTSPEDFNATSKRCLWVKIPGKEEDTKPREIHAGFSNMKTYAFKPKENICRLPLKIFGDSIINQNKTGKFDFTLSYGTHACVVLTLVVGDHLLSPRDAEF